MNTSSSRRILFTFMAVLVLAVVAPVRAEDFGHGFSDGAASSGLSGDYKRGSRFSLAMPGVLTVTHAMLDGGGGPQTGFQSVSMVVYQDANGVPGAKLAQSAPLKIAAGFTVAWVDFSMGSVPLLAGNYWLVLHTAGPSDGSTPGIIRDYGSSNRQPPNWYGNADTFADGASTPFGAGSTGAVELLVYGTYLPSSKARFTARANLAATPSGGLTSNTKRGSRFILSEPGRLFALAAYVDGKGGASGSQKLRYSLYRDSGGVPTSRVVESEEVTIKAGQSASWVSARVLPTDVVAGNYWIVIHTGDTSGVTRDFGDGAANWYSNADTYADGAASSFGTGNSGTVTLTASAMYIPGVVQTQTLGRTTIATTPSGGLSANFSRGSEFGGLAITNAGVVTAFWAYLDGNGGGSGSQQVRIAVYADPLTHNLDAEKGFESEVVSIPAGTSPRWVRFPLKAPVEIEQNPAYWIMLQSGSTAGIVRNYGDGPANWAGFADPFADGAVSDFSPGGPGVSHGTVTLSLYIESAVPGTTQ